MHGANIKIIIITIIIVFMQKELMYLHQKMVCAPNSSLSS